MDGHLLQHIYSEFFIGAYSPGGDSAFMTLIIDSVYRSMSVNEMMRV